jgi:hypothetical protein
MSDDEAPDDVIPASITAPRGLPPARAELSRFMAYRAQIAADIARLETGRDRLVLEIAKAAAAKLQADEAFDAQAVTLAEQVLTGVETLFAAFAGKREAKPVPDTKLAKAALAKLEAELTSKQALADRLQDRSAEFTRAALREHGAVLGQEYLALLDQLRNTIGQLHALDVACGGPAKRDVRAMLPGFCSAGQPSRSLQIGPSNHAIDIAIGSWRALAQAWSRDAKAAPSRHLKFVQRDRQATEFTTS